MKNYALITGASSGMGLEYAHQLAAVGWNIILVSNREDENRRAATDIASRYGVKTHPYYIDLTDTDAAQRLYNYTRNNGLQVDILINNAGMLLFSTLERTAPERLDTIVALHCATPMKLCRLFAADMRVRRYGYVLIMSSITAWTPYPTISHYSASKAFLRTFGRALWYEMRDYGVGVTTVFPSAVDTPFYNLDDKMRRRLLRCGVMMSASSVARKALRAMFRRRRSCLPGFLTKVEAALCATMPAWVLLPILKIPAVRRILEKV